MFRFRPSEVRTAEAGGASATTAPRAAGPGLFNWPQRVAAEGVSKQFLNKLVMDYLLVEGFKDAAEAFAEESGTEVTMDLSSINERVAIRECITNGDIEVALSKTNDIDTQILDTNKLLLLRLLEAQFLNLVVQKDIVTALQFARDRLAPLGDENPEYLHELEYTMSILAFPDPANSPLCELLDNRRYQLASQVNSAILSNQFQRQEPQLNDLVRQLISAQEKAESLVRCPIITGLRASHPAL